MKTNPDTAAFASQESSGLTKREYFAGIALQGLIVNNATQSTAANLTMSSVVIADRLIQSLNAIPSDPSINKPSTNEPFFNKG